MSQKRMTIAPIVKAQLPKINFNQIKQEQQLVQEILLTQQNFHDSRDLVSNIINEKKRDQVNQSFQDQQNSYLALKEKLGTTKEIFHQKIVAKPLSRQYRSNSRKRGQNSMIINIRDDQTFQWVDELYKKNNKSHLLKPARNPNKIQENMSRLSNRKQLQTEDKINEEDSIFELQGLNTNKNLKNFITWEDPQTPQQIINQFKNDQNYHAKCPFFENNTYTWAEVQILDYDNISQKFIVKIIKNGTKKQISRISLLLKNENEIEFKQRLQQCRLLQKQAEEELRFFKYVNNIPDNLVSELTQQIKQNILKKLKNSNDNIQIYFDQIEYEYKLFMKKFLALSRMNQSIYITDFIQQRIKMRNINDILQKIPKMKKIKKDYQIVKQQMTNIYFLNNKFVMKTFFKIYSIKQNVFELITTKYQYGQLPFVLSNLDQYNHQMNKIQQLTLLNNWRTQVIQDVQDILRSQYNFYITDKIQFEKLQLNKLIKRIDLMFNQLNKQNIIDMNLTNWINHIKSFTLEAEKLNKESFIQINITIQQIQRKKTTLLHKQSLINEDKYAIFEPSREQIINILNNPIISIKNTLQELKSLGKDLFPLIDLPIEISINMESVEDNFVAAQEQIIYYVDFALKEPIKILEQFNEFSFLYTKSITHLMRRLFGDSKEKPAITYIDLDKIKEKLDFYNNTIKQIEKTCIDDKKFTFFLVKTKQAKITLIQKCQEIILIILNKLSEILTDNINRVGKYYQDMCEKILQEPKEEYEMVQLKNFIAETEVNLAKLANEVNLLFQTLELLMENQYNYEMKQIENLWFLKQWPQEVRVALIEGARNVALQETKFTEKLDQEKEIFVRELVSLESQVEVIKLYDDYSHVKQYAQIVMGLKEKINNYTDKVKSFNDRENLFKQPITDYDDLTKIKQEFDPFYKIWDIAIEFDVDKQDWYHGSFNKLQYSTIERKMITFYQKETLQLIKLFQEFQNDKALQILQALKKDLEKFKEILWLIEFLNCEAIQKKPKIWDEIQNICGYVGDDITLISLIEHNYINYKSKIEEISKRSTYAYDIEKRMNQVIDKCKEIKLEFIKGTNIIKIDEVQFALDEQLNILLLLKQSPYVQIEKVTQIEKKIILIQDTLENWRHTQRGYLYLQPIFSSEDIRQKLPIEKNRFDQVDRFWKQIIDNFSKDPQIWENIENDRNKQDSKTSNDQLDFIMKGLTDFLEQKRKTFSRFFFLPDEGLLEILAQTKDPELINKHIQKCFEGIKELQFDENIENILAIISQEKEIVQLYQKCNVIENDRKGNVERWLLALEKILFETMKGLMKECKNDNEKHWLLKWPSQFVQCITQFKWTQSIESALQQQISLENVLNQIKQQIQKLVITIQIDQLNLFQISQISQIILLQVHNRTVVEELCKYESLNITDFNWLIHMRYYEDKLFKVSMLSTSINYGYEYYGLTQRLVITPLTDRCYRSLLTAFQYNYGGAPEGPAGTGKTETVKDLAKSIGMQCIVFNCSDGLNTVSMGKFFKGLVGCGAWCCFDEFNRIDLEVLSVIAQQIITIQQAIRLKQRIFFFENDEYNLILSCSINITMNPGYAGRYDLPDNLKVLFRPCAMMQPDYEMIAEIYLYSNGFQYAKELSIKIVQTLKLSQEQLSTQEHYDFGMRALKSILMAAQKSNEDEESICIQALLNVNLGKLISSDIKLFESIIQDLFPNQIIKQRCDKQTIITRCQELNIIPDDIFLDKCCQFQQTLDVRHGVMIIGSTMSGKSQMIKIMSNEKIINIINPKSLSIDQLFGKLNQDTKQFTDGVVPIIFRLEFPQFIVFDGLVDAEWIENMNTVLDDNKKLCLTSGEIIKLNEFTRVLFEVPDLQQASPATVSRCGMVYMESLFWGSVLQNSEFTPTFLKKAIWLLDATIGFISQQYEIQCTDSQLVRICINLLKSYNTTNEDQQINVLLFCILWTFGNLCNEDTKKRLNSMILKLITASNEVIQQYSIKLNYPYEPQALHLRFMEPVNRPNLFDFFFDIQKNSWTFWNKTAQPLQQFTKYEQIYIQCNETIKNQFWISQCLQSKISILLIGQTGTGKTSQILQTLLNYQHFAQLKITFSGQTQTNQIQQQIEQKINQRRCKGHYGPEENKSVCVIFIDDVSMCFRPTELIRQHIDNGGWYDIQNKEFKYLEDSIYVCATQKQINQRFMRHFMLVHLTQYSNDSLLKIFGTIIQWITNQWSSKQLIPNFILKMSNTIANNTIQLFQKVKSQFLPIPSRCHYIYSLRDVQKIFKGIYTSDIRVLNNENDLIDLWQNECQRVLGDRLVDQNEFNLILEDLITSNIKKTYKVQNLYFGNFLPIQIENKLQYGIYHNLDENSVQQYFQQQLHEYNCIMQNLNILLFKYAIDHLVRIIRGIQFGNMLLIGMTGSGRQSLSKLATYIVFNNQLEFFTDEKEEMQQILRMAGLDQKNIALFINCSQIKDEKLEELCNLMIYGELPNLFNHEDKGKLIEDLNEQHQTYSQFIQMTQENLKLLFSINPYGEQFRNKMRKFPSLINYTTLDWFTEWPENALNDISQQFNVNTTEVYTYLKQESEQYRKSLISRSFQQLWHLSIYQCQYLEFLKTFESLLKQKTKENKFMFERYTQGVDKILETESNVMVMKSTLQQMQPKLHKLTLENSHLLINLQKKQKEADQKRLQCQIEENDCAQEQQTADHLKQECQFELDKVLPILAQATQALEKITNEDMIQLKSFQKPPQAVSIVMEGMCYIFDEQVKLKPKEPGSQEKIQDFWGHCKKNLLNDKLIKRVREFKEEQIKAITEIRIQKIKLLNLDDEKIFNASKAAGNLGLWIKAVVDTYEAYLIVNPKQLLLSQAVAQLQETEKNLAIKKAALNEILHFLGVLQQDYEQAKLEKEQLEYEVNKCQIQLERAEKLITGLMQEKENWKQKANTFKNLEQFLKGNCLISSLIISFFGVFPFGFREKIRKQIQILLADYPISQNYSLKTTLSNQIEYGYWINQMKLPNDSLSIDNAIIIKQAQKWVALIDPQNQGGTWLKLFEEKLNQNIGNLENCIQIGHPILLFEPYEYEIPIPYGSYVKLNDKKIDKDQNFKLYITIKNPNYSPETCIHITFINFEVTQEGLEDQLLNFIVSIEEPMKEEQRQKNIKEYFENKHRQNNTEDQILKLLYETQGNLLEDEILIQTLQTSKTESIEIEEKLKKQEHDSEIFNKLRNNYKQVGKKISQIYQVIKDLQQLEYTYVWSIEQYLLLYEKSIRDSKHQSQEKNKYIIEYFTKLLFSYTCQSLLEKDKLTFSILLLFNILLNEKIISYLEIQFLLNINSQFQIIQSIKKCPQFIQQHQWNQLNDFAFQFQLTNLLDDIINNYDKFMNNNYDFGLTQFQQLQLVKILKPQQFITQIQETIKNYLGPYFTQYPQFNLCPLNIKSNQPICFILSSGSDPLNEISRQADKEKIKLTTVSLGQGSGIIAEQSIIKSIQNHEWVILQNCHLVPTFMKQLENIYNSQIINIKESQFRLFLTTTPINTFSMYLLQKSEKFTFEYPKGIKNNILRIYQTFEEKKFNQKSEEFKQILFNLSYFHAVVIERKKYGTVGWNIPYDFSQADFLISSNQLSDISLEGLQYLINEINYGGRVTDQNDLKLLKILSHQYIQLNEIEEKLDLNDYLNKINSLSNYDDISLFGMHTNAQIFCSINEANYQLEKLVMLNYQSKITESPEKLLTIINTIKIQKLSYQHLQHEYHNSLNTVLIQECSRFNKLISIILADLHYLSQSLEGFEVLTEVKGQIADQLLQGQLPKQWINQSYPTTKDLASYIANLTERITYFQNWIENGTPEVFNLSYFYYPQGFLTGIKQEYARKNQNSIDILKFEFKVNDHSFQGYLIQGLFLDQAQWDQEQQIIIEPNLNVLYSPAPMISINIVLQEPQLNNQLLIPVYTTKLRKNKILEIPLNINENQELWIIRGVALLCSN